MICAAHLSIACWFNTPVLSGRLVAPQAPEYCRFLQLIISSDLKVLWDDKIESMLNTVDFRDSHVFEPHAVSNLLSNQFPRKRMCKMLYDPRPNIWPLRIDMLVQAEISLRSTATSSDPKWAIWSNGPTEARRLHQQQTQNLRVLKIFGEMRSWKVLLA